MKYDINSIKIRGKFIHVDIGFKIDSTSSPDMEPIRETIDIYVVLKKTDSIEEIKKQATKRALELLKDTISNLE